MTDILFKTDDYIFSYRVAGICIENGKVLLQKPANDSGYAFPGGHVSFGETNEETLIREFQEETGLDVKVDELKWVAEIFFPWGDRPCHQICLYYMVKIKTGNALWGGSFKGTENIVGRDFDMDFYWVELEKVKDIKLYPENAAELLKKLDLGVQHFVYRE